MNVADRTIARDVENHAVLMTRAAHLMRTLADAATDDTGSAYWFSDRPSQGRCSVISEHVGTYIGGGLREAVALHVARWDPDTAASVAGTLELAARVLRLDGHHNDLTRAAQGIARSFMRSYGEPI